MNDPVAVGRALVATAQASLLAFLRLEIGIANTMIDGAAASHDEAGRRRRHLHAAAAYDEVVRYLGLDTSRTGLTPADRDELLAGLRAVHARFALAGVIHG